jgi:hypothetical protein
MVEKCIVDFNSCIFSYGQNVRPVVQRHTKGLRGHQRHPLSAPSVRHGTIIAAFSEVLTGEHVGCVF